MRDAGRDELDAVQTFLDNISLNCESSSMNTQIMLTYRIQAMMCSARTLGHLIL
jgi:hypothetical protein